MRINEDSICRAYFEPMGQSMPLTNRVRITTNNGPYEGEIIRSQNGFITLRLNDGSTKVFDIGIDVEIRKEAPDEQRD